MTSRGRQYPDGPLEPPPGSLWERLREPEMLPAGDITLDCYWPIEDEAQDGTDEDGEAD